MTRFPGGRAGQGLALGLAAGLLALLLEVWGVLTPWEWTTWTWRARYWAQPSPVSDRIKVIALDQASLDWAAANSGLGWPWPRQSYGLVVDYLKRAGARAVIFDVLFTEPSTLQGDDAEFAAAIRRAGNVTGALSLSSTSGSATVWPAHFRDRIPELPGGKDWLAASASHALLPVPEIADSVQTLGNVGEHPDSDQMVRWATLVQGFDGHLLTSLSLAPLLVEPGHEVLLEGQRLSVDGHGFELDEQGRALLRYRGRAGTHQMFSAASVIQSELRLQEGGVPPIRDASVFKDCYVFFGLTAPGLNDLRVTPVDPLFPGVEVHATVLDNLLTGDGLRQGPVWATRVYLILIAALCGFLGVRVAHVWQNALAFIILPPIPLVLGFVLYPAGFWWPVIPATLAVGLALTGAVMLNYATEGRQKRFIKTAFRHYLSPLVIEQILADPDSLKLGGERREMTILFSDLQGFTGLSETLEPEALTALLNDYLSEMSDFILARGGTLDKYEGDAIIAFWNAPLSQPDHALAACQAALQCQQRLQEREEEFTRRVGRPLRARIGLNTGPVVVGNMGSRQRFDYTVLGDAANLASRLEGANKVFGTPLMVSSTTWEQCRNQLDGRRLGKLRVVGRSQPVTVYQPLSAKGMANAVLIRAFEAALEQLEHGDLAAALQGFDALGWDPAAQAYSSRLRELAEQPDASWDGVWNLSSK